MTTTLLNNRYQIISELGKGGFGETFLAEDTQMPSRRRCVIKQLKPGTDDPQTYQLVQDRFGREAAVLEQLGEEHSQIPKLYAYFEFEGEFYLVQEWIKGETLTDRLQKAGQFSDRQVRELLTSLLPVLNYVHSHKILHRDIKPDNIIFRQQDGLPVLIDFGAVKETMNTVVTSSGGSTPSIAIGTPGFMPAEQAAGRPVYSSDLYALGMTGIFLLTGKLPQELETDSRTGQILWRQQAPQVTPNLALVLDRSIRFNPGDRYYSAAEMLKALQPVPRANVASDVATVAVSPRNPYAQTSQTTTGTSNQESNTSWLPIALGAVIIFSAVFAASVAIFQNNNTASTTNSVSSTPPASTPSNSNPPATNNSRSPATTTTPNSDPPSKSPVSAPPTPTPTPTPSVPNQNLPSANQPETQPKPKPETQPETQPENPPTDSETQPSEPLAKPSRTKAIRDYYEQINQRQYSSTWNQLSSEFKRQQSGSYEDYLAWWNSVKNVEISKVNVIETGENTALVDTQLTYSMQDGRVSQENMQVLLIWDQETQKWLIDQTNRY